MITNPLQRRIASPFGFYRPFGFAIRKYILAGFVIRNGIMINILPSFLIINPKER
ncbi:MAG: hypothetical protein ACLTWE_05535 [Dysgonomonas mossii]|uniref:hypothetical protein n=1 Tax=Dysgonomonas TaxID=156973 RepID=UPI00208FC877|nr:MULTISPECIES: hypothetical protein [Dysgonomonas]